MKLIQVLSIFLLSFFSQAQVVDSKLKLEFKNNTIELKSYDEPLPFKLNLSSGIEVYKVDENVKYRYASFKIKEKNKSNKSIFSLKNVVHQTEIFFEAILGNGEDSLNFKLNILNPNEISIYIKPYKANYNRIEFDIEHLPHSRVWGLGVQPSFVNHFGNKPFVFVEEQGLGRGDQPFTFFANLFAGVGGNKYTSYYPKPFYISENLYSVELKNIKPVTFDFTQKEKTRIKIWNSEAEIVIRTSSSIRNLIEQHTQDNGRFPELPDWSYGTWMGLQGGWDKVLPSIHDAVMAGNPVTALWIQDWCGRRKTRLGSQLYWNWQADEEAYPQISQKIDSLNNSGIKVLGYINPFIANEGTLMQIAKDKNFLVKNKKGENYLIMTGGFPAYMLDLSNPEAVIWIKSIIKENMIGIGLSGWMADFAEWLPFDAVMHDGRTGKDWHNVYPVAWAGVNRQAIQEAGKEGEILFFTRSGYVNSDEFSTLFWMGDQMVNWGKNDGIKSVMNMTLSSAFSGIALNHSDIGGYTTVTLPIIKAVRKPQLLNRWSELNVFSPVFRTHEGVKPDKNIQVYSNPEEVIKFAFYGKLHFQLKPYLKTLVKEAHETGIAPARPMFLEFPNDEICKDLYSQMMLGSEILFAPVLKKNAKKVKVYLPKGEWIHYFSKQTYKGEKYYKVAAPVGQPAFFIKSGSPVLEVLKMD